MNTHTSTTELVHQFGIKKTDAQEIMAAFKDHANGLKDADMEYAKLDKSSISEATTKEAKRIRLLYKQTRVDADHKHKEIKEDVLARSKAIDGARNIIRLHASEREKELEQIEKHFEIQREKELEAIANKRMQELKELGADDYLLQSVDFRNMTEEVFQNFIYAQKKKAEDQQREEEERQRREEEEKKMKQKAYNDMLERNGIKDDNFDNKEYLRISAHNNDGTTTIIIFKSIDSITI